MIASGLFPGVVTHARTRPRPHRLRYRIFQLLLDLDELAGLDAGLKAFSVGRFNLLGFEPRDHLSGDGRPLRDQVAALLAEAGVELAGGAIRVLCMPRVLGHAFNPISVWFCHRPDGGLAAMLYEVNNTFGERHVYVLPVAATQAHDSCVAQSCEKQFFVSPFMPMALNYRFKVRRPAAASVSVHIEVSDGDGTLLLTSFQGERRPLTDGQLFQAWAGAPLLSLKVVAAIHWEALQIWLKRIGLQRREPVRDMGVTIVRARETAEA